MEIYSKRKQNVQTDMNKMHKIAGICKREPNIYTHTHPIKTPQKICK